LKINGNSHKKSDKTKRDTGNPPGMLIYPIISNVASGNETTGMFPTPPVTRDEYDSYKILSSMELPEATVGDDAHIAPQTPGDHAPQTPDDHGD